MTQEAFIKELERKGYSYKIVGDKIVVTHKGGVDLRSLTSLPLGVEFNNGGYVNLRSLETLPPGVEFKSERDVWLHSLTSIPPGVEFKSNVYLGSLIGEWFSDWSGNIDGIGSKRLLNKMISMGLFDRR